MVKLVYDFAEGGRDMKDLLGGKGANLAEMTGLGLPVPPGFGILGPYQPRRAFTAAIGADRGLFAIHPFGEGRRIEVVLGDLWR